MNDIQPVTKSRFHSKSWISPVSFNHLSDQSVAPLVVAEMVNTLWALPMAFIANDDHYSLVAMMSLEPNRNLLVDKNGSWIGRYLPRAYRSYPFCIAESENNEKLICIDESSDLIVDSDSAVKDGVACNRFYSHEGDSTAEFSKMKQFLEQLTVDRELTVRICRQLQELELLVPWPIEMQSSQSDADSLGEGNTEPRILEGLFTIDEPRLNSLTADNLVELRESGGLLASYVQLLSRNNLQALANLASTSGAGDQVSELFLDQVGIGDSLNFENL